MHFKLAHCELHTASFHSHGREHASRKAGRHVSTYLYRKLIDAPMIDTHRDESMLGTWLRNTWQPPKMICSSKRGDGGAAASRRREEPVSPAPGLLLCRQRLHSVSSTVMSA